MTLDLERDFAAFVDRRDPDALTRVFDATAGRLLLLAAHLVGGRSSAEDLVQATFLAALRRGASWDRGRPLWPWIATILHNEARMLWRRERNRREVGIEAADGELARDADPALLIASEDTFAAVVAVIDALPVHYRQVLRLRLVHGLQPIEIARALEMPVVTVRVRLHRGLEQLRAAVPAGAASGLGVLLAGEGALLAQVREHVLAEAGALPAAAGAGSAAAAATPAGWWLIGGFVTMHGKMFGLAALATAALILLAVVFAMPLQTDASEGRPPEVVPATATMATSPPASDTASRRQRSESAAAESAWPLVVTVHTPGRQRIAGASVVVAVAPRGGDYLPKREIARGETAADGTFRCSLGELREHSVLVRRLSFVWVTATCEDAPPGSTLLELPRSTAPAERFVAEIELRPTSTIAIVGRVLDGAGAPVRGAELYEIYPRRVSRRDERTDAEGRFRLSLHPDYWTVDLPDLAAADPALGAGSVALPKLAEAPAPGSVIDVGTITLLARATVRGHVVLGDGTPLGGFPVEVYVVDVAQAADPKGAVRAYFAEGPQREPLRGQRGGLVRARARRNTGPDGAFAFASLDPDAQYAVAVRDTAMQVITMLARAGDDAVRLVVDRQLLLLDVRSDAGEPLPGANIVAEGFPPESKLPASDKVRPGFPTTQPHVTARFYPADAEGRRMLLSGFGWVWRIGPFDEIAQPDFVRHDVFAGVHRAHLGLALRAETRFGSVRLTVVDERGQPLDPFEGRLRCLDKDVERRTSSRDVQADPELRDLSAGRWQVTVGAGEKPDYFGDLYQRGTHVRRFDVAEGVATDVRVEVPPAGLAGFRLRSESPPAGGVWEGVTIRAVPGDTVLPFLVLDPEHRNRHTPVVGLPCVAKDALPPGVRAFMVEAKGYHPARCEVQVVADRLVTADVNLFAR